MPFDERVNLVEELDSHHDNIKRLLKLDKSPFSEEFLPVQAVLMGLPNFWQAQIVEALNDDFGIIRISPKRGGELTVGVKNILVLFHVEDVFDISGRAKNGNFRDTSKRFNPKLVNHPVNQRKKNLATKIDTVARPVDCAPG